MSPILDPLPLVSCPACFHHNSRTSSCHGRGWAAGEEVFCRGWSPRYRQDPRAVRCADCRSISYHPGPPEKLRCSNGINVDLATVTTRSRVCAMFASRQEVPTA